MTTASPKLRTVTSTKKKPSRSTTKEFEISYDNFESAIVAWMYSVGAIPKDLDVVASDFGIELNKNGNVSFDLTFGPQEHQYSLPLVSS